MVGACRLRLGEQGRPVKYVTVLEAFRDEDLHRLADQLLAGEPEERGGTGVRQDDLPPFVDDDDGVVGAVEDEARPSLDLGHRLEGAPGPATVGHDAPRQAEAEQEDRPGPDPPWPVPCPSGGREEDQDHRPVAHRRGTDDGSSPPEDFREA